MVSLELLWLLFVVASLAFGKSIPVDDESGDDPMLNPELFEGDIDEFDPEDRNARVEKDKLWPDGRIPYEIDAKLESIAPRILKAMQHIEEKTCIRFDRKQDADRDYIRIHQGKGCHTKVGRHDGEQLVSLGPGCFKFGTMVHELGHAIGFFHEQSRSDRDDYLNIHYENIKKGMERQFMKLRPDQNWLINGFDYDSIMLYGDSVFARERGLQTMTSKDGRKLKKVNHKPGFSRSDVKRIIKLYNCKPKSN